MKQRDKLLLMPGTYNCIYRTCLEHETLTLSHHSVEDFLELECRNLHILRNTYTDTLKIITIMNWVNECTRSLACLHVRQAVQKVFWICHLYHLHQHQSRDNKVACFHRCPQNIINVTSSSNDFMEGMWFYLLDMAVYRIINFPKSKTKGHSYTLILNSMIFMSYHLTWHLFVKGTYWKSACFSENTRM